ncbi:hypothetical protein [Kineococcus aurantiacus]|uniref:hypothetical protein n=1 Tax=Kineococcus aurantiacus TaxID=37633 RepID=UPI0031DE9F68
MSVTQVTSGTVTIAAFNYPVCPPDRYCAATLTVVTLTVSWSGNDRPAAGNVIDLFGTAVKGSLTPVGYQPSSACHIDWC